MKKKPQIGDSQPWGHDEVRIYTSRGWCIIDKKELTKETV